MSKLQELRELIIKANKTELKYIAKLDKEDLAGKGFEHSLQSISKTGWREEPIDLAMVLIALGKLEINWYNAFNDKTINILGYDLEDPSVVVVDLILDLTKDLNNQSEETISELLKLIKGG